MKSIINIVLAIIVLGALSAEAHKRTPNGQLIAENGILAVSDDPNVVRRYQRYLTNCLIDVQEFKNGSRQETGYYRCKSCRGSGICSVCNGRGWLGTSSYGQPLQCSCNYTGLCYCATGSPISLGNTVQLPALFPGWEMAFYNYYAANGNKIDGNNFARENREERQAERNRRKNNQSHCSSCNGTGYNLNPQSNQPSYDLIGIYHKSGSKCSLCGSYQSHWHAKCASCMGRIPVY